MPLRSPGAVHPPHGVTVLVDDDDNGVQLMVRRALTVKGFRGDRRFERR